MSPDEKPADDRSRRRHRRVQTSPAPGSDPAPSLPPRGETPEESAERDDSNDSRLKRDVPPHW